MADAAFAEVAKLARDLDTGKGRVTRQGSDAVRAGAKVAVAAQKRDAPVDSGDLRDSVGVDFYGTGNSGKFSAVIGPDEYYGRFQEWGTAFSEARPFVGPSAEPAGAVVEARLARLELL